jgi:hypothetical protein
MAYDFNTASEQRSFDVIPDRTVAVVQLNIRPGDAGEGGLFKRSKNGQAEGLDCELIVVGGPHNKRKFFEWVTISGTSDNHAQAADISHRKLRAIIESARGIKPTDVSEAAKKARIAEYAEFDGIRFLAQIGVEPAKDQYRAKNFLAQVITPDRKEWQPVEQVAKPAPTPAAVAKSSKVIEKPVWAQ